MPVNERASADAVRLLGPLSSIMREAGALARGAIAGPLKRWMKIGNSPVSDADLAVDRFLIERLKPLAPGAAWLSEETEDDLARLNNDMVWIVDPIDGTRAFLDNRPDWSVSVALISHGRPVVAALFAPVTDELFLAAAGHGATLNDVGVSAIGEDSLSKIRVAGPQGYVSRLNGVIPNLQPHPKIHSLALRLARVAHGEIDAAIASQNSHDWDLAAADLLVHEANGTMTGLDGSEIVYNRREPIHPSLIATGRARHRSLIDLARRHDLV